MVVVGCEVSISKSIEGKVTFTFGDGLVVRGDSLCVCFFFQDQPKASEQIESKDTNESIEQQEQLEPTGTDRPQEEIHTTENSEPREEIDTTEHNERQDLNNHDEPQNEHDRQESVQ